jgi:hypothetical protein
VNEVDHWPALRCAVDAFGAYLTAILDRKRRGPARRPPAQVI